MYLLLLSQFERETIVGAFDSEEDILEFLKAVPFMKEEKETYEDREQVYYYMNYKDLPVYYEVNFRGYVYNLTKYAFIEDEEIQVEWIEVQNLSKENTQEKKSLPGMTRVDAYIVENEEAKEYILDREETAKNLETIFHEQGYKTRRDFRGSEDGEAVCAFDEKGDMVTFVYLDPMAIIAYRENRLMEYVKEVTAE